MSRESPSGVGPTSGLDEFVGSGEATLALRRRALEAAAFESTVLLTGETGTGKTAIARAVHEASPRRHLPFVHVDCASLAPSLIESELFGHEKGAFTHAVERRIGRFELARGGTILLDEIGDLGRALQAKLLRVLENRVFERVGGASTQPMRARVIAATSRDLEHEMRRGRFRSDLYFRVAVLHLHLPPLRERLEDLRELVPKGLAEASTRLGRPAARPTPGFVAALAGHSWPGNVRELMNVLERVLVRAPGAFVDGADARSVLAECRAARSAPRANGGDAPAHASLAEVRRRAGCAERRSIVEALTHSEGNVTEAARRLRIPRSTLRHRMHKHGIT